MLAQFLYPTTARAQFALRTAFALVLAAFMSLTLHLDNPFWATMSAAMIMNPSIGATLERGLMRIIGTVVGALIGLMLASLSANNFYLFLTFGYLILAVGAYFSLTTKYPYAFIFGTISAYLVMSCMIFNPENPYFFMIYRIQEILVGVLAGIIASFLIFPTRAKEQLQQKLALLAAQLGELTGVLTQLYYKENTDISLGKTLIQEARKNLLSCKDLFQAAKLEFNNTALDLGLSTSIWEAQRSLFKQLETLFLNYKPTLNYTLLAQDELTIKPVMQQIQQELSMLSDFLNTLAHNPNFTTTSTQLFQNLDKQFQEFRAARKTLQYPVTESTGYFALTQNLAHITTELAKLSQLCQEATSLQQHAPTLTKPPFFIFDTSKETIQYSIKAGLTIVLATLMWMASDWPAGIQGIISAAIISFQKNIYDIQLRGELRFLGALVGGGIGLLALHFFALKVLGLLIILWVFGWIFAYYTFGNNKYSYAALQANIALCITLLHSPMQVITIAPTLERLAGVFMGIIATIIIYRVIWPAHPRELLNKGLHELAISIGQLLQGLLKQPTPSLTQIDQDYAKINAKFLKNNELLESLKTYLHDENPFIVQAARIIEIERNCATLIFILNKGTDLAAAHRVAAFYQVDLRTLLQEIISLFAFNLKAELNLVSSEQLQLAKHMLAKLTEILLAIRKQTENTQQLAFTKEEATQFLYLLNNLQQLLEFYQGFAVQINLANNNLAGQTLSSEV